jgi:hypothetical protein
MMMHGTLLVDSVESMMMHGLANPKSSATVLNLVKNLWNPH